MTLYPVEAGARRAFPSGRGAPPGRKTCSFATVRHLGPRPRRSFEYGTTLPRLLRATTERQLGSQDLRRLLVRRGTTEKDPRVAVLATCQSARCHLELRVSWWLRGSNPRRGAAPTSSHSRTGSAPDLYRGTILPMRLSKNPPPNSGRSLTSQPSNRVRRRDGRAGP